MNTRRLRFYLAQVGCEHDRRAVPRSPNEHCDDALKMVGFAPEEIARLERAARAARARQLTQHVIFQTANVVAFGLAVHRYERAFSGTSMIIGNWESIRLAYSIADALGWGTTTDLVIVTAKGAIPIGTFLFAHSEEIQGYANALGVGAEVAAFQADLTEALVTGGLSIALSAAAWGTVRWMNAEPLRRLKEWEERAQPVLALHTLLASGALPQAVREHLPRVPQKVAQIKGTQA